MDKVKCCIYNKDSEASANQRCRTWHTHQLLDFRAGMVATMVGRGGERPNAAGHIQESTRLVYVALYAKKGAQTAHYLPNMLRIHWDRGGDGGDALSTLLPLPLHNKVGAPKQQLSSVSKKAELLC